MSKQIQDAYIVAATRLPVAKRNGMFKNVRPDDMLAEVIRSVVAKVSKKTWRRFCIGRAFIAGTY